MRAVFIIYLRDDVEPQIRGFYVQSALRGDKVLLLAQAQAVKAA